MSNVSRDDDVECEEQSVKYPKEKLVELLKPAGDSALQVKLIIEEQHKEMNVLMGFIVGLSAIAFVMGEGVSFISNELILGSLLFLFYVAHKKLSGVEEAIFWQVQRLRGFATEGGTVYQYDYDFLAQSERVTYVTIAIVVSLSLFAMGASSVVFGPNYFIFTVLVLICMSKLVNTVLSTRNRLKSCVIAYRHALYSVFS